MPYSIIFFSSDEISLPLLRILLEDPRFEVLGVVCQPDRKAGRHFQVQSPPVKHEAKHLGLGVFQPEKLSMASELFESFSLHPPDLFLTFAYGQIFPSSWLQIPRVASLNVHPSLLPLYRGPSPIQTALLHGNKETGISLIKMGEAMDAGPIAFQVSHPIPPHVTAGFLSEDLGRLAAECIPDVLIQVLEQGKSIFRNQDDSRATYTKKLQRSDGFLNFQESAQMILWKFQAYTPWPGVYTSYLGQRLKLCDLEAVNEVLEPGKVRVGSRAFLVGTLDGAVRVKQVQLEGKKILHSDVFLIGQKGVAEATLPS